ncbi:hypothetical protein SEVIR_2G411400v4 [Setaria viridis]|uniref:Uncharacterized protein n=2 Tax=Setaria viridis TaxID=4556 RepID=A0A4U6W5L6_SETVI|nr:uncharacterized protein LOC117844631 isoform X2 [Setaria viridis]TKW35989.1 hypothetical protein SEVIR_2G411400v2 [Setaria viridis]
MQGPPGESYGLAAMDFDYVPATPGSRWAGESAARRRQRRLSSPSLRTYLTPAFDAVAAGDGGVSGYSSSSSGGLDLGFDASLLRYRRACFAASADLDSRVLLYSPQSAPPPPPPPPQMRTAYPAADDGVWAAGGGRYGSKREAGRLAAAPGFQEFDDGIPFISPHQATADHPTAAARGPSSNSIKLPADLRSPEDGVIPATNAEFSTPKPEAQALAEPAEPTEEEVAEALYSHHRGHRRLPIFRDICPE